MIISIIISFIIGIILTSAGFYIYFNSKIKSHINEKYSVKLQEYCDLVNQITSATLEKNSILSENEKLKKEKSEQIQNYYQEILQNIQEKLSNHLEIISKQYQDAEDEYKNTYLQTMQDYNAQHLNAMQEKQKELENINNIIADMKAISDAAIANNIRQEQIKQQENFYKLQLSEKDIEEITEIKKIATKLRNPELLNKVLWKIYYEKPYTDLIGRVLGSNIHTGIYKITNLENKMCYVGQSVNIAERWKQHIKRGIGAEAPTKNKLYPAMQSIGVENFSFELIEDCDKTLLNSREDYWQEYFKAKEFGYSIK